MKILLLSSSRFMECQWGNSNINCDTNHVYIPLTVNEVGVTWSFTFFSLFCFLFLVRVRARFRYSCTEGSFCLAVSQLPTLSNRWLWCPAIHFHGSWSCKWRDFIPCNQPFPWQGKSLFGRKKRSGTKVRWMDFHPLVWIRMKKKKEENKLSPRD